MNKNNNNKMNRIIYHLIISINSFIILFRLGNLLPFARFLISFILIFGGF